MDLATCFPRVGFGTSGVRALVEDLTPEAVAAYTRAFIRHLESTGQLASRRCVLGWDLRPSSPTIAAAVAAALRMVDVEVEWAGTVPTPALALHALELGCPGIMVSGSHIPFDRNGLKFYTARGEISKEDEAGIAMLDASVTVDRGPASEGSPGSRGSATEALEDVIRESSVEVLRHGQTRTAANMRYLNRYTGLLPADALRGLRVGVYQHSAVGRELLVEMMRALGAEVTVLQRSDAFVPIDTEAVSAKDEELAAAWCAEHGLQAVVSTDGDGDRPWICDETGRFLHGDVVGILTARWLGAEAVVTPVSSNTALEKSRLFRRCLRTRIGSPFVVAGMQALAASGPHGVVGFEANGGFLLEHGLRGLRPLPTRDSALPILAVLATAQEQGVPLSRVRFTLPERFTRADRLKDLRTEHSTRFLAHLMGSQDSLHRFFGYAGGSVRHVDQTDGLRVELDTADIIHFRPSGNAPELRCYVESTSSQSAEALLLASLAELRRELGAP